MPEKDSEDSFYYLNAYQDDITPGQKMTILHNISFNDWRAGPHIAPLVTLTREEVTQRKEASITLEKELYAQLKKLAAAWDEQAAQTMLLERALEYLQTPEVEHTSNEWKQDKNGIWEISNRTYKMRYKISYEKAADVYLVSWGIIYNAPKQPDSNYRNYWGDSIYVARQDKKKYPSMEAAQHYIQGRFDLYCHLFREISPPVPNECRRMFSINGYLAAGYTLAPPDKEEPNKKAVDDLLACLDDADAAVPPAEKPKVHISEKKAEAADIPVIVKMSEAAAKMVRDSVNAYVEKDLELSRAVIEYDDVVDEMFEENKKQLIDYISKNSGEGGKEAIDLIMVAKYLERIADHATNIAEWVEFSITGIHKESKV